MELTPLVCPDCGKINDEQAMECIACGSPKIASMVAVRRSEGTPASRANPSETSETVKPLGDVLVLELLRDPSIAFEVRDGQVVGSSRRRSERADVTIAGVPDNDTISSRMARFQKHGDQWFVEHVGNNHLMVDGHLLNERGYELPVYDSSQLTLALTEFTVRMKVQ